MNTATFTALHDLAASEFRCGKDSVHGVGHWRNVEDSVVLIAALGTKSLYTKGTT